MNERESRKRDERGSTSENNKRIALRETFVREKPAVLAISGRPAVHGVGDGGLEQGPRSGEVQATAS